LANGGLFAANSLLGPWHPVLGGDTDSVEPNQLWIGVRLAFPDSDTVLLGLDEHYRAAGSPVLYRAENGGATWTSVSLPTLTEIEAMNTMCDNVWMTARHADRSIALLCSDDGGKT
jgi:hypothetical protein